MRILVPANRYPPAAVGGDERMCRDVVERFRRPEAVHLAVGGAG